MEEKKRIKYWLILEVKLIEKLRKIRPIKLKGASSRALDP